MYLVILDFSKAFHRVTHQRLLAKINHYGIQGQTYKWIESCLPDRSQQVIVDGAGSDKAPVVIGVLQGTDLAPSNSFCLSMTYQIVSWPKQDCLQTTVSSTDLLRLQRTAYSYKKICTDWLSGKTKWGMCFHPEKCSILRVTRARSPVLHPYTLKGQILHTDEQSKYLGIDITSNLSWNPHLDRIVKKGNSMLGFLQRNLRVNSRETKASA